MTTATPSRRGDRARGLLAVSLTHTALLVTLLAGCAGRPEPLLTGAAVPEGEHVLFLQYHPQEADRGADLYAMHVETHALTQLTQGYRTWGGALSPDGRWMAVGHGPGRDSAAWIVLSLRSGESFDIALDGAELAVDGDTLAWSPDSGQLAFSMRDTAAQGATLTVLDVATREVRDLTSGQGEAAEWRQVRGLAWSPDGAEIALVATPGDRTDTLYVVGVEGGEARRIAEGEAPDWSPDGAQLAYSAAVSGGTERDIFVVNADGTQPHPLSDKPGSDSGATWSPDGRYVAFVESVYDQWGGTQEQRLYIADAQGERVDLITDQYSLGVFRWWLPGELTLPGEPVLLVGSQSGNVCWVEVGQEIDCPFAGSFPAPDQERQRVLYADSSLRSGMRLCIGTRDTPGVCPPTPEGTLYPVGWVP